MEFWFLFWKGVCNCQNSGQKCGGKEGEIPNGHQNVHVWGARRWQEVDGDCKHRTRKCQVPSWHQTPRKCGQYIYVMFYELYNHVYSQ